MFQVLIPHPRALTLSLPLSSDIHPLIFLSYRFCIVGQSASSGAFAAKSLKLAVFGKSVSSGLDLGLSVRAVEATASAWERCLADCDRNGLELLAAPKQVRKFRN